MLLIAGMCFPAAMVIAQQPVNGTTLFDDSYVHRIDVTFTQNNFWDSLEYYYNEAFSNGGDVKYMMTTVSIDGVTIDSVGFKEKGFYSNWGAAGSVKKPFKVSLSKYVADQKYDGLKKINLSNGFEDPTIMRDVLAYKFMRDAGINAPRTAYAKVYLNNTYWGLYVMVEEIDKRFLKNWFANDEGNLFKCINNTSLAWQGNTVSEYEDEFELQTNEDLNDWSQFLRFVDQVNNSGANFNDSIDAVLDVNKYLYVLAADVIMFNWDSYYEHGRNFFIYNNPDDHRMNWIPWDYNLAFSDWTTNLIIDYSQTSESKPLVQKLQADPEYRTNYFNSVCILKDNYFTMSNLEPFIDETAALIRPELNSDPNKFFTINEFDTGVETDVQGGMGTYKGLKQFIGERQTAITNQLASYNHTCSGLGVDELGELNVLLYPNPFQQDFTLSTAEVMDRVEVYSLSGQLLLTAAPGTTETVVSLSGYASGSYLVKVFASGYVKNLQITKQ
jgi:spore coat protein CotH